jgi:hypothetical protein
MQSLQIWTSNTDCVSLLISHKYREICSLLRTIKDFAFITSNYISKFTITSVYILVSFIIIIIFLKDTDLIKVKVKSTKLIQRRATKL